MIDKKYLILQFRNKIYELKGTAFQSFFEELMYKYNSEFIKIKPLGRLGDGGNDGYIRSKGEYYQVYSPETPAINHKTAAKKMVDDYNKLINNWNHISEIKTYYFVYNDKYEGSSSVMEESLANLIDANPNVTFVILHSLKLQEIFNSLDVSAIDELGFDLSNRNVINDINEILYRAESLLDKNFSFAALNVLEYVKDLIKNVDSDDLILKYRLLYAAGLKNIGNVQACKSEYQKISESYPNDTKAMMKLAEIAINNNEFDVNQHLLERVETSFPNSHHLHMQRILRMINIGEINWVEINSFEEPIDMRSKASMYNLLSVCWYISSDVQKSNMFIQQALEICPNLTSLHSSKLRMLINQLDRCVNDAEKNFLIDKIQNTNKYFEDLSSRGQELDKSTQLDIKIFNASIAYHTQKYDEVERKMLEAISLVYQCYFDNHIEIELINILGFIILSKDETDKLVNYLEGYNTVISEALAKVLLITFIKSKKDVNECTTVLSKMGYHDLASLLHLISKGNADEVIKRVENDITFAKALAVSMSEPANVRLKLIKTFFDDAHEYDRALFHYYFENSDYKKAYPFIGKIKPDKVSIDEHYRFIDVALKCNAWDTGVQEIRYIIESVPKISNQFKLKRQLMICYSNLKNYRGVIQVTNDLLEAGFDYNDLCIEEREQFLSMLIYAYLERGKIDKNKPIEVLSLVDQIDFMEGYTFEFVVGLVAELFIACEKSRKALSIIVSSIAKKKVLNSDDYGRLFFLISTKIGNTIELPKEILSEVIDGSYITFKNNSEWFCVGGEGLLGAKTIHKGSEKYEALIGKVATQPFIYKHKYSDMKEEMELSVIFDERTFIINRVLSECNALMESDALKNMTRIHVPETETGIDMTYILKAMEDFNKPQLEFFKLYCENILPLAYLAVSEGSVTGAIGRISNEKKGLIRINDGNIDNVERQRKSALKILENNSKFIIDGTSALFLSEYGLIQKYKDLFANAVIPHSVIIMLSEIAEKANPKGISSGTMGYINGRLRFNELDEDRSRKFYENIVESIKVMEQLDGFLISETNRMDFKFGRKAPNSLCDPYSISEEIHLPIMSEDSVLNQYYVAIVNGESKEIVSSIAFVEALNQLGKITDDDYFGYFGYMASYRCHLLPVDVGMMRKSVGIHPEIVNLNAIGIRQLGLGIIFSESYGNVRVKVIEVVTVFVTSLIVDDRIDINEIASILIELDKECQYSRLGNWVIIDILVYIGNVGFGKHDSKKMKDKCSGVLQKILEVQNDS